MLNFLLFISLILNIIALFSVVLLYLRQNRLFQVEKKQEKLLSEMEEAISSFLIEMKEENEKFIERVKRMDVNGKPELERQKGTHIEEFKIQKAENEKTTQEKNKHEDKEHSSYRKGTVFQAVQAYKSNYKIQDDLKTSGSHSGRLEDEKIPSAVSKEQNVLTAEAVKKPNELYMQSLLNQALLLQKQGLSNDEIAKKLNKGKTEIELLFKFRQNKQE